jgi:hypothetical protein
MPDLRLIPWRKKFTTRFYREGDGWFWSLYLGVFAFTFQWRYCFMTYTSETSGIQFLWIPLKVREGGLLKCLVDLTWKRDVVREFLK